MKRNCVTLRPPSPLPAAVNGSVVSWQENTTIYASVTYTNHTSSTALQKAQSLCRAAKAELRTKLANRLGGSPRVTDVQVISFTYTPGMHVQKGENGRGRKPGTLWRPSHHCVNWRLQRACACSALTGGTTIPPRPKLQACAATSATTSASGC